MMAYYGIDLEELERIAKRAAQKPSVSPWACGVCLGHSPEWDGHNVGCRKPLLDVLDPEMVLALIARIRRAEGGTP